MKLCLRDRMLEAVLVALIHVGAGSAAAQNTGTSSVVSAQVLFERGNAQLERAQSLSGARRRIALEEALAHYGECLALARTRNVLFNTALALEQLERNEQAFNIYQEFLGITDLLPDERSAAAERQNRLRPLVGVLRLRGANVDARVWLARRDLPALTGLPLEQAVSPGPVQVWIEAPNFEPWRREVRVTRGEMVALDIVLEPSPVQLDILVPPNSAVLISGVRHHANDGRVGPVAVLPGEHEVQLINETTGAHVYQENLSVAATERSLHLDWRRMNESATVQVETELNALPSLSLQIDDVWHHEVHDGSLFSVRPGARTFRIEREGNRRAEVRTQVTSGDVRLRITVVDDNSLVLPRVTTGVLFLLSAGFTALASVLASNLYDEFNRNPTVALANESDAWVTAADIGYVTSGVLAVVCITLLLWPDPSPQLSAILEPGVPR